MGGFFVDLLATQYNQVCHGINTPLGLRPLPPRGEKICCSNGFSSPLRRAERKETALWAVLAKEPACRDGSEAARGLYS